MLLGMALLTHTRSRLNLGFFPLPLKPNLCLAWHRCDNHSYKLFDNNSVVDKGF